jgi:tetratricopeptide (TPR) repeat protein
MYTDVTIWNEEIVIPTYNVGKPEKNPMFLEKRVYQGSCGVVYPYPVIEKIADEKEHQVYQAVFLENSYLKIMILPELGGRIQMAYDKIKQRHFVYYNHVIKPALVGLTGPWISGGIEFNWPQHHRPSTFLPVDYTIEERDKGVKTIWINEVEVMFRTKARVGFTLHPEKAYLEIEAYLCNRTLFPQTFLWWANPAVKVNDFYQSIFPPDVHAVFDHGKRDVSSFPIAKGVYYKMDYSPGTDISRYKNIPVPTSFMAVNSKYDFMGGYEHDTAAGMLHVANHHTVPGKKQWTWGNADFGKAWDRNLTDEDGPYIELMTGAYTDNQPDFSWLQPNEEKSFVQYFMPYHSIGVVRNANKNMAVHLDLNDGLLTLGVYASGIYERARVLLNKDNAIVYEKETLLSPKDVFLYEIKVDDESSLDHYSIEVLNKDGCLVISYHPENALDKKLPLPATAAPQPSDVNSIEELYLHGIHLEQYRHATFDPTAYYQEALHRDSGDIRNNNAMGLWFLRRGFFKEAEKYFRNAQKRLLMRNANPYDSEVLYNLALTLKFTDRWDDAYELFYKAAWSAAWKDNAYMMLARIDLKCGRAQLALEHIEASLERNAKSSQALHVKLITLRKLMRYQEALSLSDGMLGLDAFNYGVLYERYILFTILGKMSQAVLVKRQTIKLTGRRTSTFIEYALDYMQAGCYEEAASLLNWAVEDNVEPSDPLVYYHLGYALSQGKREEEALLQFKKAAACSADYGFPNRIEDMLAIEHSLKVRPDDAKGFYYLGNYWYDKRMYETAIEVWEKSALLDPSFPTVKRNLALAYYNKQGNFDKAMKTLAEAFELDKTDARVLMELDQLYKLQQVPLKQRIDLLDKYIHLVEERDDLYLERITLLNLLGRYEEAFELITKRKFHPWEGGEGKVISQYLFSGLELAKKSLLKNDRLQALHYLSAMETYPFNLGEGKLPNASENDVHFLLGLTYEQLEKEGKAKHYFQLATQGEEEPVQAIFYNDPQPDKIFYQGLSWIKLGNYEKAKSIFDRLDSFGRAHMDDEINIDYMAVSLPDLLVFDQDLSLKNRIHCSYMLGLAALGNGEHKRARELFAEVLNANNSHLGASIHLNMISFLTEIKADLI